MAKIEELLSRVTDPELRAALAREIQKIKSNIRFGLVYEEHVPEVLKLPNLPVRPGVLATPDDDSDIQRPWLVERIEGEIAFCSRRSDDGREEARFRIGELVVVKRFGDPIYPALIPAASVRRSEERPYHVIIQADNYHALQLLQYTHAGSIDLIYIDPPYNTGAQDWKYNNNYVDSNDAWRHSKWLAMMKRRLVLARRLLKEDGVLVVSIDENEHATLSLLLREKDLFHGYDITSVAVVHNPRGTQGSNFSFTNEFAVFVIPKGKKILARVRVEGAPTQNFRNWGGESLRTDAANCFYPIYVKDGEIVGFGDVLPEGEHPSAPIEELPDGRLAVWPIDDDGVERKWRYERGTVEGIRHLLRYEEVSPAGRPLRREHARDPAGAPPDRQGLPVSEVDLHHDGDSHGGDRSQEERRHSRLLRRIGNDAPRDDIAQRIRRRQAAVHPGHQQRARAVDRPPAPSRRLPARGSGMGGPRDLRVHHVAALP